MKALKRNNQFFKQAILGFLLLSFLCLTANIAIPSLHAHLHELEDASPALTLVHAGICDQHNHVHHHDHDSDQSHRDPASHDHSSNCHICRIIAHFSAETPVVFFYSYAYFYQQFVATTSQSIFTNTPVLKEYSHGPPSIHA